MTLKPELIQGSKEWLELRKTRIGGSEAGVVLGLSPYKTPLELWKEKTGRKEPDKVNIFMQKGTDLEPVARGLLEHITGKEFSPTVELSKKHPFMLASLDGITFDGKEICELKCGKAIYKDAVKGVIKPYTNAQGQHNMETCESRPTICHFLALNPDSVPEYDDIEALFGDDDGKPMFKLEDLDKYEYVHKVILKDENFIKDMLEAEKTFFQHMLSDTQPALVKKDKVKKTKVDPHLAKLIEDLKEKTPLLKSISDEVALLKREILFHLITEKQSVSVNGIEVNKSIRKGKIDYKALIQDQKIDELTLESFRQPDTEVSTILIKEKI